MKVTIRHAPAAFASAKRECGANYAYICEVVTSYRHMAVTPVKGLTAERGRERSEGTYIHWSVYICITFLPILPYMTGAQWRDEAMNFLPSFFQIS